MVTVFGTGSIKEKPMPTCSDPLADLRAKTPTPHQAQKFGLVTH